VVAPPVGIAPGGRRYTPITRGGIGRRRGTRGNTVRYVAPTATIPRTSVRGGEGQTSQSGRQQPLSGGGFNAFEQSFGGNGLPPPSLVTEPDGPIGDQDASDGSVAVEETNIIPGNSSPGLSFFQQVLNPEPAMNPAHTEGMMDESGEHSSDEEGDQRPFRRRSSSSGGIELAGAVPEFGHRAYQGPLWLTEVVYNRRSREFLYPEAVPDPDPDLTNPEERSRLAPDRERMARALAELDQVRDPTQEDEG
jgi:hypothetical protein